MAPNWEPGALCNLEPLMQFRYVLAGVGHSRKLQQAHVSSSGRIHWKDIETVGDPKDEIVTSIFTWTKRPDERQGAKDGKV